MSGCSLVASSIVLALLCAQLAHAQGNALPETPPDAKPGECYGLVYVPAFSQAMPRQQLTAPARAEWQRVLCETNLTPALVQSLQEALRREGVFKGPANGYLTPQTAAAVRQYQERHALPAGGLSLATLERLGVSVSEGQTMAPLPLAGAPAPVP